jgi:mono/diheme cytochrome c family protein
MASCAGWGAPALTLGAPAYEKHATLVVNRSRCITARGAALLLICLTAQSVRAAPASDAPPVDPVEAERFHAVGPPLTRLGAKLADPSWLVAWLLHPSRLRPHKLMRSLRIQVDEARVLAGYLYSGALPPGDSNTAWQGGNARTGEQLFVSRGCRGCHSIGATERSPLTRAPDLAGIGVKVRPDWLFDWLKSPRSYDPNTAMPQLALGEDDIRHLVAFLMSHREGAALVAAAPRFQPGGSVEQARTTMVRFNCARCHLVNGFQTIEPTTRWAVVPAGCADCHQASQASRPAWEPTAPESPDAIALQNGRMLVGYYNCRGCHRIEGSGGVIAEHLERKTFAPPALDGEGARVQTSWLVDFLQRPKNLRPWLQIQMPNYGLSAVQAAALARYFAILAHVPPEDEPHVDATEQGIATGERRFAHFKCIQCHPAAAAEPCTVEPEDLSIDLMLAKTRLRPSWVRDFLARPKAIVGTETRMPAVFYSTDGVAKVDHPEDDIAAIAAYLSQMTEPPRPLTSGSGTPEPQIDWTTQPY